MCGAGASEERGSVPIFLLVVEIWCLVGVESRLIQIFKIEELRW
jgi:hypothetical protein